MRVRNFFFTIKAENSGILLLPQGKTLTAIISFALDSRKSPVLCIGMGRWDSCHAYENASWSVKGTNSKEKLHWR